MNVVKVKDQGHWFWGQVNITFLGLEVFNIEVVKNEFYYNSRNMK